MPFPKDRFCAKDSENLVEYETAGPKCMIYTNDTLQLPAYFIACIRADLLRPIVNGPSRSHNQDVVESASNEFRDYDVCADGGKADDSSFMTACARFLPRRAARAVLDFFPVLFKRLPRLTPRVPSSCAV